MLYAPTYASIQSLSVTDFVWATATDTTVTFSEPVTTCAPTINGAGASVVVKSFTTGTNTAVFTVTAANGSNILSTTLLDVNEGVSAVDTKAITSAAPVSPTPDYFLDASIENSFTYNATTKLITAISQANTGMTYQKIGGAWKANTLNGLGTIDFLGLDTNIACVDMTAAFSAGSWTISYLVKAADNGGSYTLGTTCASGTSRVDRFVAGTSFASQIPFTINGGPPAALTKTITMGKLVSLHNYKNWCSWAD
jgi:hypothetical protein